MNNKRKVFVFHKISAISKDTSLEFWLYKHFFLIIVMLCIQPVVLNLQTYEQCVSEYQHSKNQIQFFPSKDCPFCHMESYELICVWRGLLVR